MLRLITGWPDGPPQEPAWVYTDWVVCKIGLLVAVAALDYRRRTGEGQHIDAAQYETMEHLLTPVFLNYVATCKELSRIGNRSTVAAPHGVYRCRGERRYCCITVFTDEVWRHFCKVIGKPQWIESPKFSTVIIIDSVMWMSLIKVWRNGHLSILPRK